MFTPTCNLNSYLSAREIRSMEWRSWFAWRPVKLACGRTAWFEFVYRRKSKIELERIPTDSPGCFTPRVKLSDYVYITDIDYIVEIIKGKESYFQVAQRILRNNTGGVFDLG